MLLGPITISHHMGVQTATLRWNGESYHRPPPLDRANNLVLTIFQKYHFVQMNPGADGYVTDFDRNHFQAQPWNEATWTEVCRSFINLANLFWDNRFWLRMPAFCQQFDYSRPVYRPNVKCLYHAQSVNHDAPDVITVQVANPTGGSVETGSLFRVDNRHWIPSSTALARNFTDNGQISLVHEIGHNLGEDHVAGFGGEVEDYGGLNPHPYGESYHRSRNIMGGGMIFEGWNAYAWQFAMQQFTQIPFPQWEGSTSELLPDPLVPQQSPLSSADMTFTLEEAQARRPTIILGPFIINPPVRHRGHSHRRRRH